MSYLGRKPIKIPTDTNVEISDNHISVQGPLGTLERSVHEQVDLIINDTDIVVNEPKNKKDKPLWATTRSLVMNMVIGVTQGHSQTLKVVGWV
jgi:large subunit ribosomal protein L6